MISKFFHKIGKKKKSTKQKNVPETFEDFYQVQEKVGDGTFSVVRKAQHKFTNKTYAVKILKKSQLDNQKQLIANEIEILGNLDHPNVIKMKEIFDTPKKIFIVMEYVSGGELFNKLQQVEKFSEHKTAKIIKMILLALQYLHKNKIVHRDLKPENLLYTEENDEIIVKLTDFGLSKILSSRDMMTTACGTPYYVAPEIIKREPYGPSVDIWSTGVIIYVLLTGCAPFYDDSIPKMFDKIKRGAVTFPLPEWDGLSKEVIEFIKRFLTVDVNKRITIEEALEHPWILSEGINIENLK
ncbi:serine/threonine-protein kinase dclk3 [Anaeramoeba flamelloides]|uniref:Serine/threonine-protein kinase dclk3 n=1 Tax=Anaeramoeba flamelloides TaxID=1746091 RepID=A0ABQ8YTX8_9EUKA|nr:serine/threonine-protein kinase dclk3 [Anaeramoeba flamelloides]